MEVVAVSPFKSYSKPHLCVAEFSSQLHPIIIVPTSFQPGSLSLSNVHQFLEKGTYVEKVQAEPQPPVQVKRRVQGREVIFDVYDSVFGFSDTKWRRVVAVICSGADWQFKGWKPLQGSGSELNKKELFARVRGYFMSYSDQKVPQAINSWNVMTLAVPRN